MIRPLIHGRLDINALLAFVFGVVFLIAMLTFAVFVPNPSGLAQWVFVVTTSLAGAGVGAMIPGILKISLPYARAGGALAVFLLIFFNKPTLVETVGKFVPPNESPLPAVTEYLSNVDSNQMDAAWSLLDSEAKATVARDREMYKTAYTGGRRPLGAVVERVQIGVQEVTSPTGYPPGIYRMLTFKTKFASGQCHAEQVSTRATTSMVWRVFDHTVSVVPIPC